MGDEAVADNGIVVELIPILEDNYAFLIQKIGDPTVAVVDPGEAAPILALLEERGLKLGTILITHKHADHIAGVDALRDATGAKVIGSAADAANLPKLDQAIRPGEHFSLLGTPVEMLDTPGHCDGHISYHLPEAGVLFCGDVLFTMGCGRVTEGPPATLWKSLQLLAGLPDATKAYSGHEYTLGNARFAVHVFPDNREIAARNQEMIAKRERGEPTVPTTIGEEKRTNPFLLAGNAEKFAELREAKNSFRG